MEINIEKVAALKIALDVEEGRLDYMRVEHSIHALEDWRRIERGHNWNLGDYKYRIAKTAFDKWLEGLDKDRTSFNRPGYYTFSNQENNMTYTVAEDILRFAFEAGYDAAIGRKG